MKIIISALALMVCFLSGCQKKSVDSSQPQDFSTRWYGASSHDGAPFYCFQFTGDKLTWALFIEGGYFYRGGAQSFSLGGETVAHLVGLDGREDLDINIDYEGQMIYISMDGKVTTVPQAYMLAPDPNDIYSGKINVSKYPFLEKVNEVFDRDKMAREKRYKSGFPRPKPE